MKIRTEPLKQPTGKEHNLLRKIRVEQDLSLEELADKTGFTEQTIRNWERGFNDPFFKVQVLATALGVQPGDFFIGLPDKI